MRFTILTLLLISSQMVYSQRSPNFIVILADDQGWTETSVQMMNSVPNSKSNYHQTPNLKKLAAQGMRFSSGYAPAPVCVPSRFSIQFGQTPARLGITIGKDV
jgi:arylsulfatase A-like enzyme